MYPVEYDVYDGDKKNQFDKWFKNSISVFKKI